MNTALSWEWKQEERAEDRTLEEKKAQPSPGRQSKSGFQNIGHPPAAKDRENPGQMNQVQTWPFEGGEMEKEWNQEWTYHGAPPL